MYDEELVDFFNLHNISFSVLNEDQFNGYAKIENYPFIGSRIAWSHLNIHISKQFHELNEFANEIEKILLNSDKEKSSIVLLGNDFQYGYNFNFSFENLKLALKFLIEYPGENYLFGFSQEWCICIYDVLDFGLPLSTSLSST